MEKTIMEICPGDLEKRPKYMETHIRLCRVIAMWPLARGELRWTRIAYHKIVVFSVTMFCLLLFLPLTLKIVVDFKDMDGIATVIDFATVFASGIFRYVYIYVRADKYLALVDSMYDKFSYVSFFPANRGITMEKYIKIGTLLGLVYFGSSLFWVLQMCFGPILVHNFKEQDLSNLTDKRDIPLVFQAHYPFDLTQQPSHSLVYIFQVLGFLALAYIYLITDAFWYMVIILTIGQLDLINHSLKNIKTLQTDEDDKTRGEDVKRGVEICVKQHQEVRRFMEEVESLLCPNILVDFIHAVLSITFILLDMTIAMADKDWMKAFHLFEYFTVSIIHMFLFDYLGNELSLKDEQLSLAVYETPWYLYSDDIKTHIIMVTNRATRPFHLTGGKMYFVTLEFFVATVKTIFSYFMVLRQLRDEKTTT